MSRQDLAIDCNFPGGNIVLDGIDADVVTLHQDLRDTAGDWFYWCFRVRGATGRTLTFKFKQGNPIGVRGPAVSVDGGQNWHWLGLKGVSVGSFRYTFPQNANEVRFCFTIPYLQSDLQAFLRRHAGSGRIHPGVLCETNKHRPAELLHLGRVGADCTHRVLITARHHACESIASFVLEGVMETVLSETDDGRWLCEQVEFLVVPFMDKDGVEDGNQGKNRKPRDHNRDYDGESIHATTCALRRLAPEWSAGKLRAAIDLHCPHIRGASNEVIYFVGTPDQRNWQRTEEFSRLLESACTGPLPFSTKNNLPYGTAWNTAANYTSGKSFSRWAAELPDIAFATSIEVPYANASGKEVTADSARAFGRDIARTLRRFLQSLR